MDQELKNIIKSKFAADSLYNLASVLLLGTCGLILNIIIARKYNAQTLGIFNEIYAVYIVFSQFAALGVQVSVLKHIAEFSDNEEKCRTIFTAAFSVVLISACVFSVSLYLLRYWIAEFFRSPEIATGILYIIPGLWCFSMNKLFLNVLNGFRQMKAYAFFTSFRYLAMLLSLLVCVAISIAGEKLSIIFSVSESALWILLVFRKRHLFSFSSAFSIKQWATRHLVFGLKSMIGGISADLNTRIDVIILGYFASDRTVGIYSFAATIVEGIGQIPYILKQNMDPILTRKVLDGKMADVQAMVKRGRSWIFWSMLFCGICLASVYPFAIGLITDNSDFIRSWPIFCILLAGLVIQSSYVPFSGILVQSGYPLLQTIHLLIFTLTNISLNMMLVPLLDIWGAAIATSLSFMMFVVYLKLFTFRALRITI